MAVTTARAGSATDAAGNASTGANLTALLRLIPLSSVTGPRERLIKSVSVDSREVGPGGLFVAIRGEKADGNRFVDDAVSRGAVAVVSEMPASDSSATWVQTPEPRKVVGVLAAAVQGNPSTKMNLVGVTGTNGKTTTAFLVDGLLDRLAPPSAMLGTVVRKIGERSEPARYTTPEAPAIQKFLAEALASGSGYGVLEVSSHGLALHRLEGTEFLVTVFTNLSRDHLDFHRDMEDYFRTKRLLFTRYVRAGATAVVSIDDAYGERLAAELGTSAVTFGLAATADLSVSQVEASLEGIRFQCREGERTFEIRSPLLGRYNALNLVAALAAVRALGFEHEAIVEALETVSGAPGRFERVLVDRPFDVIVDYAHTDDALRKLLEAARPLTRNQLIVVFGCGGERDRTKRPLMGDVASRLADRVVLTSDNPRGENPEAILREIQLGVKEAPVRVEVDRRKAIELALGEARPGDVVMIAGKGHEPYQIVGDRVLPFDDREVVREIGGASP
ncbi:MAG TPA: UDP-N-acetylmuramoyl-L-alanyl-D-glutamate--2,6-diaminopimelate ligase [Vicinamibacteria bacterium]|nr:UDP-N-acetylmuramoyl-L-alanyl-D-glutamate--2,6-diaminopimelate ligase [Vicinamibacteria bacterium]